MNANMKTKKKRSTQAYHHEFYGDFEVNDRNYQIEVCLPTKHTTIISAKYDPSALRFEKHDGHIVLVVYSDFKQGICNGKWIEDVDGKILEIIRWEDWHRYKISKAKEEGVDAIGDDGISGYFPCATNWDEIFDVKNLPHHWGYLVESIAYGVLAYFECKDFLGVKVKK